MGTREYLESLLESARQLYQLEQRLSRVEADRNSSITAAFSKWVGDAKDNTHEIWQDNLTKFEAARGELEAYRNYVVRRWANHVDSHNDVVRAAEITSLQQALDLYHDNPVTEMNTFEASVEVLFRWGDDGLDVVSDRGIRVDDADRLVDVPVRVADGGRRPTAPDYLTDNVFVNYERNSNSDPTLGVYVWYNIHPE